MKKRTRTAGINCERKQFTIIENKRVEIRKRDDRKESLWYLFKEFLSTIKIGESFSRNDIIDYIYSAPIYYVSSLTTDKYILVLTKLGFIERIEGRSECFIKIMNIPMSVKYKIAQEAAYDTSWKKWFIPLNERLGANEQAIKSD